MPLYSLLLDIKQTAGIEIDTTIELTWILGGVFMVLMILAGFFFGLWLTQRDHSAKFKTIEETVNNSHIARIAESEKMRQDFKLEIQQETNSRLREMQKMESNLKEDVRMITDRLQSMCDSQIKTTSILDTMAGNMTDLKTGLSDVSKGLTEIYQKYDLTPKK